MIRIKLLRAADSRLSRTVSLVAAAAGGLLLDLANPGLSWWPLAFPAVALILAGLWQQRAAWGLLVGAVAGFAFWGPHISWLTLYLGPVPWGALVVVMTAWFALFGMLAAVATRGLARTSVLSTRPGVLIAAQALTVTGLWVLREGVQSTWPYGGFSWGRVATTQATGVFAESVSWIGVAGLTAAIVLSCGLVVAAVLNRAVSNSAVPNPTGAAGSPWKMAVGASALLLLVLAVVPVASLPETGTLRVAAVQGNSKSGIFDDRESGDVFRGHADETARMLDELEARGERVDLIVWPENSAEFDLPGTGLRDFEVAALAKRADAPIVAGSILRDPDGSYTNSAIVWGPDGDTGQRYDKRFPVPFAEYMPNREFFRALAPDLVDLVQLDYTAGTRSSVLDIETSAGSIAAGLAICFDITFDRQAVAMIDDGAELLLAPTNNADFGRTDESVQQLQIARLRAIETGRALVNISTVGTSEIVAPDGTALDSLTPFTADTMLAEVPLVVGRTPALEFGGSISGFWTVLGALGVAWGAIGGYEPRRARKS